MELFDKSAAFDQNPDIFSGCIQEVLNLIAINSDLKTELMSGLLILIKKLPEGVLTEIPLPLGFTVICKDLKDIRV